MGERRRKKKKKRIVETYQAPHQKRSESDVQTVGWVLISSGLARSTEVVRHSDGDIGDPYHDGDGVSIKEKKTKDIRGDSRHEAIRGIRISAEVLDVWCLSRFARGG